uniref:AAA+ ATPase domain-containing protein n=1 Tax=Leersia perrieri TaxID=77586 RepID=A0A0D9X4U0_9ORYZ
MEDAVDAFLVIVDGVYDKDKPVDPQFLWRFRKKMGKLFKKSKARRDIAFAIEGINEKLKEADARRGRYAAVDDMVSSSSAQERIDPRLVYLYQEATTLVGIQGQMDKLVQMLSIGDGISTDELSDQKMKIVSVVGIGGLGKTTLVKAVYDKFKHGFDCRAFVQVGQKPDMKKVLTRILIDLDKQAYQNSNITLLHDRQIIDNLREILQEKRCFVVIDDVWDSKPWKLIKCALQGGNSGGRVVITTRKIEISTHVDEIYEMRPLSRDDSKALLLKRIFDGEEEFVHGPRAEACDDIISKCGGVPLAIITIVSLLAKKPRDQWSEVHNSIGLGMEKMTIEEYELPRNGARRLALQYYIDEEDRRQLANMEMEQLRSFVEVHHYSGNGAPASSHVLRVLALQHFSSWSCIWSLLHLRYLRIDGNCAFELPEEIGDLKFLQVLDLSGTCLDELPESVSQLKKLLCLRVELGKVPASLIGKLTSLQELWIRSTDDNVRQFVKELGKLIELRVLQVLLIYDSDERLNRDVLESICNMSKLQTVDIQVIAGMGSIKIPRGSLVQRNKMAIMPSLEYFEFGVNLRFLKDAEIIGIDQLRSLSFDQMLSFGNLGLTTLIKVEVCSGTHETEVEEAEAVLAHEAAIHPNCPALETIRQGEQKMRPAHKKLRRFNSESFPKEVEYEPNVRGINDMEDYSFSSALHNWLLDNPCVKKCSVYVDCEDATVEEVEEVEAAVRCAIDDHPNCPTLEMERLDEDKMVLSVGPTSRARPLITPKINSSMDLVTGAMGSLLAKLGQLLKEEYGLHKGVKDQVMSLSLELKSTYAALHRISEVPLEQLDEPMKLWARDVRELSYDMEDIIDTFLVRVDGCHGEGANDEAHGLINWIVQKMVNLYKKNKARREIAIAVKDIHKKLQDVADRRDRNVIADGIVAKPSGLATIDPRLQALYKKSSEFVGIDRPMGELIKMLQNQEEEDVHMPSSSKDVHMPTKKRKMDVQVSINRTKFVSVFGSGGLGKTTLAKAVYDKLKPGFDCGAFVLVGQKPDMKKVFRDILIDLDKQTYTNSNMMLLDERQLINELQEFVRKKRCFIVIDDIWDKKSWELIRCALQENNCRSRVVTTTRNFDVATCVGDVYKMQPLSHDESKKLLYTRIVDSEDESIHRTSAEACDKILKKCGGVPLAIVTIASLLANKPRDEWSAVYNSIGLGHGGNDDVENTRRILSLSYYDLPLHLKPCLLYLSIFPEDYYIEKNLLIWKWVAEGLVHKEHEAVLGLYEIGEGYFNELINRSMIQPVEIENKGYIDGCCVHDMVLDLIRLLSTEDNFVTILDGSGQQQLPGSNARRLALHHMIFEEHNWDQLANMRQEHLRSFSVSDCEGILMLSQSFQVLRVLAIENRFIRNNLSTKCLQNVGSLLHLRYLGLTKSCTSELPKEVGDLKFLQVLDLLGTGIQELPEAVGLLTKLLCLRASETTKVSASLIEKLTSLQEMCIWPCSDDIRQFVKVLGKLRELRVLRTSINTYELDESVGKDLLESLRNLHKIQTVDIKGTSGTIEITWDVGFTSPQRLHHLCLLSLELRGLPVWINSSRLQNLRYMFLQVHFLKEKDMETLGMLPELSYLKLYSHNTVIVSTEKSTFSNGYFPKLRFFCTPFWFVRFDMHGRITSRKYSIMPCLEYFKFTVHVRSLKDASLASFDKLLSFENLGRTSLRKVQASIYCENAHVMDVEEAESALAHVAAIHPSHPTLRTSRQSEDGILWP